VSLVFVSIVLQDFHFVQGRLNLHSKLFISLEEKIVEHAWNFMVLQAYKTQKTYNGANIKLLLKRLISLQANPQRLKRVDEMLVLRSSARKS